MRPPDEDRGPRSLSKDERFIKEMDATIAFHRNRQDDPYDTANAVVLALLETRNAFAKANGLPVSLQP